MRRNLLTLLTTLFLIVATLAVYWQVGNHEFINFDDNVYVTENLHVQAGLTLKGVKWAFTTTDVAYWHPVTWLSLMLDYELYGLSSRGYHLTNLLFHILSALLLFAVLKRMTGAHWQSAFVAALFALHPLNVESVAWVVERKNVLSAFFWMLTMWTYARYAERPQVSRYLLILIPFALGLMAKPMLVTLPFVLLLLDYWPLGRFQVGQSAEKTNSKTRRSVNSGYQWSLAFRLVLEKVPLLALSVSSIYLSSLSVQRLGVVVSTESAPMSLRIANALVSYVGYIGKMIWPHNLAVFYPPPDMVPIWQAVVAALFLAFVSVLVIRTARHCPYLAVGWLWYIGTLVPVIGLVRAGLWPAMADRFAYVPLIGLFVMIAWGVADLAARWRYQRLALSTSAGVVLLAFAICAWLQAGHWKNNFLLFKHTVNVTANNWVAHNIVGSALAEQGRLKEAMVHYSAALRIKPYYTQAHFNMGVALVRQGRLKEAISHYSEAVRIKPDFAEAYINLGIAYFGQGDVDKAISEFRCAISLAPRNSDAHYNLGIAYGSKGLHNKAFQEIRMSKELSSKGKWDLIRKEMKTTSSQHAPH